MATIDIVGIPFPTDDPPFASDRRICNNINTVESLIELTWDLNDINLLIAQIGFIGEKFQSGQLGGIHGPAAQEGMIIAAVITYARMFNHSKGRTRLKAEEILKEDDMGFHVFLMDLRNQFLAHQQWNANRHHLHYFKGQNGEDRCSVPRLLPNAQWVFGQAPLVPRILKFSINT